jgi:hypothetical protein
MRKAMSQTVVIVVLLVVVIVAGIVFWRVASPKKRYFVPGVGEVTPGGPTSRGTGTDDGQERRSGPGTGRRGAGGGG